MIIGAHSIIYSADPEADRAFFKDILNFSNVDVGGGWLIFGLPPAEVAIHPAETSGKQAIYLMCEDIDKFVDWMGEINITCTPIHEEPWGRLVDITLPGGGELGVYQATHDRPATSP